MDVGPSVQDTLGLVYRLQTIDSELAHINREIESAQEDLRKREAALRELQVLIETEKNAMELLSKEKRSKEEELRTNETIISENKKKNKELKHSREIQAYLSEMEFRRDEAERLQEEIIRMIDQQEGMERLLSERETDLSEKMKELEEERSRASEGREMKGEEIGRLDREKVGLLENFPPLLLSQYSRLRQSHRNGLVVSRIRNGTCEVCNMSLPPRTLTEVKKRQKIIACLHCQRWLFMEVPPKKS